MIYALLKISSAGPTDCGLPLHPPHSTTFQENKGVFDILTAGLRKFNCGEPKRAVATGIKNLTNIEHLL